MEDAIVAAGAALSDCQAKHEAATWDLDIPLPLKQGQVETEPEGISSNMDHAVFIHRYLV